MSQGAPTPIRGQKAPQTPDYAELAAFAALVPPPETHVRFPWRDLDGIYGPLLPGSVHILSARTGSGKTLFVLNWIYSLISANPHVGVGYFPLETPAREVLARLACHTLGVHPAAVLRGDFSTIPDGEKGFRAQCEVLAEHFLKPRVWPGFAAMAPKLWLWDEPTISVERIRLAVLEAAEAGCRVIVVDHLLRLELGDGSNLYAEVSKAIRALKMLAEEAQVVMVVTSQQSRQTGGNRLAWYAPPDLQALKGAGTIEEEADGVLFLHRVLKDTITQRDKTGVENGIVSLQDVVASDIMGCAIGKHRLDGGQVGAACRLYVDRGLVSDLPDHVRREWEAAKNAIATTSKVY